MSGDKRCVARSCKGERCLLPEGREGLHKAHNEEDWLSLRALRAARAGQHHSDRERTRRGRGVVAGLTMGNGYPIIWRMDPNNATKPVTLAVNAACKYAQAVVRTARKPHRCNAPKKWKDGSVSLRWNKAAVPPEHRDIAPGEQYVEEFGEALPWESGDRYCRACALASGLAVEA